MKHLIFFLFILINIVSCSNPKTDNINETSVDFVLNDCEATYKGKPLPMGKPVQEWIKILGKPSRILTENRFIWDELGIAVEEDGHANKEDSKKVRFLFIFFSNLDSENGQNGKLRFARDRKSLSTILEQYNDTQLSENGRKERIERRYQETGESHQSKYIYPYKTYDKPVSINGAYVIKGMSLKEINQERSAKDLHNFTFADFNMNMVNEQWKTKGDEGEYWEDEKTRECKNQNFVLFNSVRFSEYELEFIRVSLHEDDNHTPPISLE